MNPTLIPCNAASPHVLDNVLFCVQIEKHSSNNVPDKLKAFNEQCVLAADNRIKNMPLLQLIFNIWMFSAHISC